MLRPAGPSPTARVPVVLPTATRPASPTADPDAVYAAFTIAALAQRQYGGGELEVIDTLERTERFTRYLIRYPSDGLNIYGFLSVPHEGRRFPVAIVVHGYIPPAEYQVEAYTTRYATALTEAGYLVIHPNLRNFPPSDSGSTLFRVGYAVDLLNLMAIIREQSQDPTGSLRRADASQIHLMGHSLGGGAVLRAVTVWPESVRAAVLYGSMSGDEEANYHQIQAWTDGRLGDFELRASPDMLRAIGPIYHLNRIQAAISIHHAESDPVVPYAWSESLCQALLERSHPVECHTYWGQAHTFRGQVDALFIERMISFFDRY